MLKGNTARRNIPYLSGKERAAIFKYMQNEIDIWIQKNPDAKFTLRDLFGGKKSNWNGTPLQVLHNHHLNRGDKAPFTAAAKDAGWLLKDVIINSKDIFVTEVNRVRNYKK